MIINSIKNIKIENYYQYIPAILIFIVGLILSFFRWASQDEVCYLKDTMIISEFLKMGQWFGNEDVGGHGFISKFFVALLYIITGPSIWIATLFNILLASITAFIMHKVFFHFTKNELYSMLAVFLSVFSYYYISVLPTFLRDIPVMFALFLFIYALIKEKPFWLLGLLLLIVFDAKEYIAVILTPVLLLWVPISEYFKIGLKLKFPATVFWKLILLFTPSVLWIYLMFWTPIVPVNDFTAAFLKLTATESNIAKVNLEKQSRSFGTDTTKLLSTIQTDTISKEDAKKYEADKSNYIKSLEPVKRSLKLRASQPKRLIATKDNMKKIEDARKKKNEDRLASLSKLKTNKSKENIKNQNILAKNNSNKKRTEAQNEKIIVKEKSKIDTTITTQNKINITKDTTKKKKSKLDSAEIAKNKSNITKDTTKKKKSKLDSAEIAKNKSNIAKDTTKKKKAKVDSAQIANNKSNIAKDTIKKKKAIIDSAQIANNKANIIKDTTKKKISKVDSSLDTKKKEKNKVDTTNITRKKKKLDSIILAQNKLNQVETKTTKIDTLKQIKRKELLTSNQKIKRKEQTKFDSTKDLTGNFEGKQLGDFTNEENIENLTEEKFKKIELRKDSLTEKRSEFINKLEDIGISILNVFIVYGQKILSPRTFSYMSFPLYLIIFSLFACFSLLKQNYKRPDFLFISIYLFIYLAVYLIRPSHARYLLHLVPILSLYVIYFFTQGLDSYKKLLIPVLITLPLTAATLYFEITMPLIKLLAHLFFYLLLFFIIYLLYKKRKELAKKVSIAFFLLLSFFTFGSILMASYTQGQIIRSITFGQNNEYKKIAKYFDKKKTYWFNSFREHILIQFYNKDINQGIQPWRIGNSDGPVLKYWLPKAKMESKWNYIPNFYHHSSYNKPQLHSDLNTDYIAFLYSKRPDIAVFPAIFNESMNQNVYLEYFSNTPEWLELEKKVELKNKTLYIYKILYYNE